MEFESDSELRLKIERYFDGIHQKYYRGPVWTTDGVYRETKGKLIKFRRDGILGVNMETSALLAVARYRGVKLASIQVISDILSESGWLLAVHYKEVGDSMKKAMRCALEALCSN
jgi:purine-nucleoside phosphorylase